MRISQIDLQCNDIMWFAIDVNGCVIALTSGGTGDVPEYVCRSKSETEELEEFFMSLPTDYSSARFIDESYENQFSPEAEAISERGIYYFDACSDIDYEYGYSKISVPDKTLHLSDLPLNIQEYMSDHIIDIDVSATDRIRVRNAY